MFRWIWHTKRKEFIIIGVIVFIVLQGLSFLNGSLMQPMVLISDSFSAAVYAILSAIAILLIDMGIHGGFNNGST